MRSAWVIVAIQACRADDAPPKDRGNDPAVPPPTTTTPPPTTTCDPVDVTGLVAEPLPENPLGARLEVSLSAASGAVVRCTLEAAPPYWKELVPLNAEWRYDDGGSPDAGFEDPAYDDGAWSVGPAPFAVVDPGATVLAATGGLAPAVSAFRTTFEVADPAAVRALSATIRRDDGVVVWVNGVEVVRDNVPVSTIDPPADERVLHVFELDPAVLVAGTNTLAVELDQAPDSADAGFALRLAAEVDEFLPETHALEDDTPAVTHDLELLGLLAGARYTCEARSTACDGAAVPVEVTTADLPVPVPPLGAPPGLEVPRSGAYTLFNHSRPCASDRTNRLFIVDPEGRVRWWEELPIDAPSSIDIESQLLPDGTVLWGGGEEPEGVPTIVGLDGVDRYVAAYPGSETDIYHHDIEGRPDGTILGVVESTATDGAETWDGWALVEHDPATGAVTWRWDSQQAFDAGDLARGYGDDPWHANSLAAADDVDGPAVYVSLLSTDEIVRIDRASGRITWRLGATGDFALVGPGSWFGNLHAIDVFPSPAGDRLFLYDNGSAGQSRAVGYTLDTAAREATQVFEWTEPTWFEPYWGDADQTADGTVLIAMAHAYCFGGALDHPGALLEVDEVTGEVVWRLDFLDSDDSTYRAQRLDGCAIFANERYCVP